MIIQSNRNELQELNLYIEVLFKETEWEKIILEFKIDEGSMGHDINYVVKNKTYNDKWDSLRKLKKFTLFLRNFFNDKKLIIDERFNKLEFIIYSDGTFEENYFWDDEKEKQDKLDTANVFFQWINDTMMNRIFDYEKENNLLTPNYDEDGDFIDYQDSWDKGVFTFLIENKEVTHQLKLFKNGVERELLMPLPEYFIDGLLEHYKITNQELKEEWKPWNKLVVKSPNNSIPYNEWEKFVTYSLEETDA